MTRISKTSPPPWVRRQLAFACGYCSAPVGAWCTNRRGELTETLHADRSAQASGEPSSRAPVGRRAAGARWEVGGQHGVDRIQARAEAGQ